jgi:hypothetical protein
MDLIAAVATSSSLIDGLITLHPAAIITFVVIVVIIYSLLLLPWMWLLLLLWLLLVRPQPVFVGPSSTLNV